MVIVIGKYFQVVICETIFLNLFNALDLLNDTKTFRGRVKPLFCEEYKMVIFIHLFEAFIQRCLKLFNILMLNFN